jgi:hypothetical protein
MKGKNILWISLIAVFLGLLLAAGPGAAGTVNFDDITPPGANPLYTGGVTFSADKVAVENNPALAVTPPNVLTCSASPDIKGHAIDYYPIMTMAFDQPEFYVTFHELAFSALIRVNIDQFLPLMVAAVAQALDQTGNLLDQDRLFFGSGEGYTFSGDRRIILSADGIKSVTFGVIINSISHFDPSQVNLSVVIDNLAFCPCSTDPSAAPIPGSLFLLGSGLVGLGGLSWRRGS